MPRFGKYLRCAGVDFGRSRTLYGVWVTGFVHRTHIRCGLHLPRILWEADALARHRAYAEAARRKIAVRPPKPNWPTRDRSTGRADADRSRALRCIAEQTTLKNCVASVLQLP